MAIPLTAIAQRRAMDAWRRADERRAKIDHVRKTLDNALFYLQVVASTGAGDPIKPMHKACARLDALLREALDALDDA